MPRPPSLKLKGPSWNYLLLYTYRLRLALLHSKHNCESSFLIFHNLLHFTQFHLKYSCYLLTWHAGVITANRFTIINQDKSM